MSRKNCFVYIMGSLTGTLYTGMTSKIDQRVFKHKFHTREGFTDRYDVERLLYRESYDDVHKAIAREKQIKGWRREKKIALIESTRPFEQATPIQLAPTLGHGLVPAGQPKAGPQP